MKEVVQEDLKPRSFAFDVLEFVIIVAYVAVPLSVYFGLFCLFDDFRRSAAWGIRALASSASAWPLIFVPAAFRMAKLHAARLTSGRDRTG